LPLPAGEAAKTQTLTERFYSKSSYFTAFLRWIQDPTERFCCAGGDFGLY
jgi:hypothetical protein